MKNKIRAGLAGALVAGFMATGAAPAMADHRDRPSFSQIQRNIICGWFPAIC